MSVLPASVEKVIEEFEKLPGVGPKSAARMAHYYLRNQNQDAKHLAQALLEMSLKVRFCKKCFHVSENDDCVICSSPLRDQRKICIVEESLDIVAFENSGIFNGLYFVLGGVISPAEGVGADELRFDELFTRINELVAKNSDKDNSENNIGLEIIVATNPSLEGEATAVYIQDLLKNLIKDNKVYITRLAMGLPTGADLEYADRLTLKRALEGRRGL